MLYGYRERRRRVQNELRATCVDVAHQLCCAHALRELAAGAALVALQKLVAEAIATGADARAPDALDTQVQLYCSAARIGATQTTARTGTVRCKHNALARRLLDRRDDYLRFTADWRIPSTTTAPNAASA